MGEAMMRWSFRPAIEYWAQPSDSVVLGTPQYVLPLENVSSDSNPADLLSLVPSDYDEQDTKRIQWALDGDVNTPYPENTGVQAQYSAAAESSAPLQSPCFAAAPGVASVAAAAAAAVATPSSPPKSPP